MSGQWTAALLAGASLGESSYSYVHTNSRGLRDKAQSPVQAEVPRPIMVPDFVTLPSHFTDLGPGCAQL